MTTANSRNLLQRDQQQRSVKSHEQPGGCDVRGQLQSIPGAAELEKKERQWQLEMQRQHEMQRQREMLRQQEIQRQQQQQQQRPQQQQQEWVRQR